MVEYPFKRGCVTNETDQKDIETIQSLVKICKVILKRYKKGIETEDKESIAKNILPLIYMENDLLTSLNMTEEKLSTLEQYFEAKAGINRNTELLFGVQANFNADKYAYYRIIARLRNMTAISHPDIRKTINALLTDYEVALLYKCLIEESKKGIKARKDLENYAYMILMNSPEMEVKILENGLNPLDKICDTVDIITDYLTYIGISRLKEEFDDYKAVRLFRSSDSFRTSGFNKKINEILNPLFRYLTIYTGNVKDSFTFVLLSSYLKTIIVFLDEKRRKEIYKDLLTNNVLNREDFKQYLQDIFQDIETNLVPYITSVSLIPNL